MLTLSGVTAAILTPIKEDGTVDFDDVYRQVEFVATYCEAVSILGAGVSEYHVLPSSVRESLLARLVAQVKQTRPALKVVAGVSSPLESEVRRLADVAMAAGADFAQILIPNRPWGGEPTAKEVVGACQHAVASLM